jgi:hypothetical protein
MEWSEWRGGGKKKRKKTGVLWQRRRREERGNPLSLWDEIICRAFALATACRWMLCRPRAGGHGRARTLPVRSRRPSNACGRRWRAKGGAGGPRSARRRSWRRAARGRRALPAARAAAAAPDRALCCRSPCGPRHRALPWRSRACDATASCAQPPRLLPGEERTPRSPAVAGHSEATRLGVRGGKAAAILIILVPAIAPCHGAPARATLQRRVRSHRGCCRGRSVHPAAQPSPGTVKPQGWACVAARPPPS